MMFRFRKGEGSPFLGSRAFTLVELLVVIAIIGMLASLMTPSIQGAFERSKGVKCVNNLREIGTAVQQYVADPANDGKYPPVYSAGVSNADMSSGTAPQGSLSPLSCLKEYGVTLALLTCPSDRTPDTNYGSYIWSPVLQGEQPQDVHIYGRGGVFTVDRIGRLTICTDKNRPHQGKYNVLRGDGHVDTRP